MILMHGGEISLHVDGTASYFGGTMCVWEDLDSDRLNLFDLEAMAREHGYVMTMKMWWRNPQVPDVLKLNELCTDSDLMDACLASKSNNQEIEIYYEHLEPVPLEVIPPPNFNEDENVVIVITPPVVHVVDEEEVITPPVMEEVEVTQNAPNGTPQTQAPQVKW